MMSLKVLAQASAICCLSFLASHSVQAQGGQAGGTGAASDPMAIYRQAGVSQEQEMRIRQLAKDFEDQARVKAKRMMGLIQEMHQLSLEVDPDEKAVLGKQDEINQVTAEMANDRIKLLLSIRKQLTEAQKQKLVGMMKEGSSAPAAQ
ncbi:MAG: periplasmic heavy metal sensor [Candidatus Melainabacteria bacterium]|nr:periplasmic heavy metal sensor [Candidatus Melainabacteria bacterium]